MIRFLFKFVIYTLLLLAVGLVAAVVLLVEERPVVAQATAPTASDVSQARAFVKGVKDAASGAQDPPLVVTSTRQLNSAIRLGGRVFPGYRGVVTADGPDLLLAVSVPVPWPTGQRWMNVAARLPSFDDRLRLSALQVGPLDLPPGPVLGLARQGVNLLAGNTSGDALLGAARSMHIHEGRITIAMAPSGGAEGEGLMAGLMGALRGGDMPSSEVVIRHYAQIRDAMETGALPLRGSYLQHIRFALDAAEADAAELGEKDAFTAAILALGLACGAPDVSMQLGGLTQAQVDAAGTWRTGCEALTLNGRVDSRLHFTTAASIEAASNRGVSVSVGEFKELFDSDGGSGFDFTDIAANNSGIRLANRMMAAPAAEWPTLIARIETERDVIISFDGMQRGISEREFIAKYGEVDSPAYLAEIDTIERKIDALALHR